MEIEKVKNGLFRLKNNYVQENKMELESSYRKEAERKSRKFFTPMLAVQKQREGVRNAYLENRFNTNNTRKGVIDICNKEDNYCNRENGFKENNRTGKYSKETIKNKATLKKTGSIKKFEARIKKKEDLNNKKLMKIQSLFNVENFEKVDMDKIINNWKHLADVYVSFLENQNPGDLVSLFIKDIFPITFSNFSEAFTNYNSIRTKIRNFFFLQIWSAIVFAYIDDKIEGEYRLNLMGWFENIFKMLLKNAFYMSLIITKAMRNGFISNNKKQTEEFSKSLQPFKFETGVPLIKTLKKNNAQIFLSIKNVLNLINLRLSLQFEKSYLKDLDCLKNCTKRLILVFKEKIAKKYQESMNIIQFNIKRSLSVTNIDSIIRNEKPLVESPPSKKYTLVFDLDETLVHFKNEDSKAKFLIRSNCYNILKSLSAYFEIIIFTAAQKEYADWILDKIDQKNSISFRFYREDCLMFNNCHLKDIGRLNRCMSKTIIVDNFPENFALQKQNGICIRSWFGDVNDDALFRLEKFMLELAKSNTDDVRVFLKNNIRNDPGDGIILFN